MSSQVEVLETILLYFKDFVHLPHELKDTARLMHEYGFGLRQSSKVSLVEGADVLQQHIRSARDHLSHHHPISPPPTITPSHPLPPSPLLQAPLLTDSGGVVGSGLCTEEPGQS